MPMGWCFILVCSGLFPAASPNAPRALDSFVPADSAVWVEVTKASQWGQAAADDQLGRWLMHVRPVHRFARAWRQMQLMLDLTGPQMIQQYLGKKVILLSPPPEASLGITPAPGSAPGNAPETTTAPTLVLLSKVDRQALTQLVKKLELTELQNLGRFTLYQTPDEQTLLALSPEDQVMAITATAHQKYLTQIVQNSHRTLDQQTAFQTWNQQVPAQAVLRGIVRGNDQQSHRFYLTPTEKGLVAHYVGRMPQWDAWLTRFAPIQRREFGPLPAKMMAALSINIHDNAPADAGRLDRILEPKNYRKDIQPKLGQSMVFFLEQPAKDQMIPALGIALEMKDPTLGGDLDMYMKNLMLVASMTMQRQSLQRTPPPGSSPEQRLPMPIQARLVQHNQIAYRTATVGNVQIRQSGKKIVKPVHLSWGTIGKWYVVSSDEQTFKHCVEGCPPQGCAKTGCPMHEKVLAPTDIQVPAMADLRVQPKMLANHISQMVTRWQADNKDPRKAILFQKTLSFCNVLKRYQQLQISVHYDDAKQIIAQCKLVTQP